MPPTFRVDFDEAPASARVSLVMAGLTLAIGTSLVYEEWAASGTVSFGLTEIAFLVILSYYMVRAVLQRRGLALALGGRRFVEASATHIRWSVGYWQRSRGDYPLADVRFAAVERQQIQLYFTNGNATTIRLDQRVTYAVQRQVKQHITELANWLAERRNAV